MLAGGLSALNEVGKQTKKVSKGEKPQYFGGASQRKLGCIICDTKMVRRKDGSLRCPKKSCQNYEAR